MDELLWLLANGAYWECLVLHSVNTLIARSLSLHNAYAGHIVAVRTCINERLAKVEADLIDVLPCFLVVEGVDNQVKVLEELVAKPVLLDLAQIRFNFDVGVLLLNLLLEGKGLGLVHVFPPEQELSVQVADVDGVEVDDRDLREPREREALDQLTSDATGSNNKQL